MAARPSGYVANPCYRYLSCESLSQFDSLPLTSLSGTSVTSVSARTGGAAKEASKKAHDEDDACVDC